MSRLDKDLVIPKTIEDICETREAVRAKIEMAHKLMNEAEQQLGEISSLSWPYEARPKLSIEQTMQEVDRRLWRNAFDKTGLFQFMDRKAKAEFENSLDKEPPEFTFETVRATLVTTAAGAEAMFKRGLVEFFLLLSKHHKTNTNEPFKVSKRAVMTCMTDCWMGYLQINSSSYSRAMGTFNDMDRVFKTLDGKQHHARELEMSINAAWKEGEWYEDEYYQIKGFKNGNAHILFKRDDLLEKANKLIHEYYDGQALAEGAAA